MQMASSSSAGTEIRVGAGGIFDFPFHDGMLGEDKIGEGLKFS